MIAYINQKYKLIYLILLLGTSCRFINEEETPDIDIQVELIPIQIDFQYNLYEPTISDPESMFFSYSNQHLNHIITKLNEQISTHMVFNYDEEFNITSIDILNSDQTRTGVYEFSYDGSIINITHDEVPFVKVTLHNTGQIYSIINYERNTIEYFTYEDGDVSVNRVFEGTGDTTTGTPLSISNFIYSPYGNSLFTSAVTAQTLFILYEMDEFKLTKYITTSNNKANLVSTETMNDISIDYRIIFNENTYPTSISMIERENDEPQKQVIHNITYLDITPY